MAKRKTALPNPAETWLKFVELRIDVFCKALGLLVETDDFLNKKEDEITKALNPKIITICRILKLNIGIPVWDAKNRPSTDNDINLPYTNTRPDFTCSYYDTNGEFKGLYEINLHIECKRIGNNDPSWNLNMNYITNGINRFDYLSHRYGKGANDGIMIGYIIDSTKTDIQEEINQNLPINIEKLNFKTRNKVEDITTKYKRENVEPFDFRLHHIWADFTEVN
jgi:hypothetical protein